MGTIKTNYSFEYQLLSRLEQDCEYFLGCGKRCEKHLWGITVKGHFEKMYELYDLLLVKPDWITREKIDEYRKEME